MLTAKEARRIFSYDSITGILTWRISPSRKIKVGSVAGSKNAWGYLQVTFNRRNYRVHRVIMLMKNGCWPKHQVDHKNHIRTDNRIGNLKCVTRTENSRNAKRSSANRSGFTGVRWDENRNKWTAIIRVNNIQFNLGRFTSKKDAISARKAAEIKYKFHPNHGR